MPVLDSNDRLRRTDAFAELEGHGLRVQMRLPHGLRGNITVEMALALMHGPLQLPRDEALVPVALQAIAVRGHVHHELCGGDPDAPLRNRRHTNRSTACSPCEVLRCSPSLCGRMFRGVKYMCLPVFMSNRIGTRARLGNTNALMSLCLCDSCDACSSSLRMPLIVVTRKGTKACMGSPGTW